MDHEFIGIIIAIVFNLVLAITAGKHIGVGTIATVQLIIAKTTFYRFIKLVTSNAILTYLSVREIFKLRAAMLLNIANFGFRLLVRYSLKNVA